MKFFTIKWWHGECVPDTAFTDYNRHYSTIKNLLPAKLVELHENYILHDSHLEIIRTKGDTLSIILYLMNQTRIELTFIGVSESAIIEDRQNAFGGVGFDDLGYYEFDISNNIYAMNIIFSTAIEMEIKFQDFDFRVLA